MNEPYTPGELRFFPSIDAGKYHVRNCYGNEVARVEKDQDRNVLVLWGPLLNKQRAFESYREAHAFIRANVTAIEFGEAI